MHNAVHVSGGDTGHHRPDLSPDRDIRALALLGFFRLFRTFADLPKPGLVDILVLGESDGAGRGAKPGETRYTLKEFVGKVTMG